MQNDRLMPQLTLYKKLRYSKIDSWTREGHGGLLFAGYPIALPLHAIEISNSNAVIMCYTP